jgi:hypothetical protein
MSVIFCVVAGVEKINHRLYTLVEVFYFDLIDVRICVLVTELLVVAAPRIHDVI